MVWRVGGSFMNAKPLDEADGYEANGTALGVEPRWCCLRLKLYLRS